MVLKSKVDEKSECTRSRTAVGFSYILWSGHPDDDDEYGGFASSVESMSCEVLCTALVYRGRLVKKVLLHAGSGVW